MPTYNKLFNGILHSSLSNNYHEVETFVIAKRNLDNKFNGYILITRTSRRDNHQLQSQRRVGLYNIEDIGLMIAAKCCLHNR
ncbi:MAG: hypothetical protein WA364_06970 [Candidatus Nitrosopolaris sp.]